MGVGMSFDEHPDGDPHGECAAEIARLESINARLVGALRFILAFYEPGQTYLDTNAWKQAEAGARAALAAATATTEAGTSL